MAETPLHPVAHAPVEHVAHGGHGLAGWWAHLPTMGKVAIFAAIGVVVFLFIKSRSSSGGAFTLAAGTPAAATVGTPSTSAPSTGSGAGGAGTGDGSSAGTSAPQGTSYPVPTYNYSPTYEAPTYVAPTYPSTTTTAPPISPANPGGPPTGLTGTTTPATRTVTTLGTVQQQTSALVTQAEVRGQARPGWHAPAAHAIFSIPVLTAESGMQTISILGRSTPARPPSTQASTHPAGGVKKKPQAAHAPVHVAPRKPAAPPPAPHGAPRGWRT